MRPRSKAAFEETNSSDGTELGIVARETATENAAAFFPPCPMDFKYFDSVVRSDDEAKYMATWRRTDKKRSMEDTNAVQGVPAFSATEAKEPTPPTPALFTNKGGTSIFSPSRTFAKYEFSRAKNTWTHRKYYRQGGLNSGASSSMARTQNHTNQ